MPAIRTAPFQQLSPTPTASPRVERLVSKRQELSAQIKALQESLNETNTRLLKAVLDEGEADLDGKIRLDTEDARLQIIDGKSVKLDAKTLQALGVKPSIIKRATKETPYQYVRIDAKKTE